MWLQSVFYHDLLQKAKSTPAVIVSFTRVIVIHGSRSRALPLPLGNPPGASPWTPLVATSRQAKERESFCKGKSLLCGTSSMVALRRLGLRPCPLTKGSVLDSALSKLGKQSFPICRGGSYGTSLSPRNPWAPW